MNILDLRLRARICFMAEEREYLAPYFSGGTAQKVQEQLSEKLPAKIKRRGYAFYYILVKDAMIWLVICMSLRRPGREVRASDS